jgi:hypothetical protein
MRDVLAAISGIITFILLFVGGYELLVMPEWMPSNYVDMALVFFMMTLLLLNGKGSNEK